MNTTDPYILNFIIKVLLLVIFIPLIFWGIYLMAKKLLRYAQKLEKETTKEVYKEIFDEYIEMRWEEITELITKGFPVEGIQPDGNEESAADRQLSKKLTVEKHPELHNENGEQLRMPTQQRLFTTKGGSKPR